MNSTIITVCLTSDGQVSRRRVGVFVTQFNLVWEIMTVSFRFPLRFSGNLYFVPTPDASTTAVGNEN